MKTIVIVLPDVGPGTAQPTFWLPVAKAFERCFRDRGWQIKKTEHRIATEPDLIAGYGWKPVMREAHQRWPDKVLHCDLGFWSRSADLKTGYLKLAFGGRWSPVVDREYDGARLAAHKVRIEPSRAPGKRVLVCGMSAKAAGTWDLRPQEWEERAVKALRRAGAEVIYRPKQTWYAAIRIHGSDFDRTGTIEQAMRRVDAVVSHHSNCAIDALAAGLPIYVETGIAKTLSVPAIEDVVGAEAPSIEARTAFLRQLAWHQWRLEELAAGLWLEPPAPLSGHPRLTEGIS